VSEKMCLATKKGLTVGQWEDNCLYIIQSGTKMNQRARSLI
jgi:hypothetical protein